MSSNPGHIYAALGKAQCSGRRTHIQLDGGKAKACEVYPNEFCKVSVKGPAREMEDHAWMQRMHQKINDAGQIGALMSIVEKLEVPLEVDAPIGKYKDLYEGLNFCDDVIGAPLEKEELIKARHLEMTFFKKRGGYTPRFAKKSG